jgi:heme-degrading monooxygenase HmoA
MHRKPTGWLRPRVLADALRARFARARAGGMMALSVAVPCRAASAKGADPAAEVIVAVTEVRLGTNRSGRSRFWNQVWTVEKALPLQPGLVGCILRRDIFGTRAWTMTLWENEDSIHAFMQSAVHRKAMQDGLPGTLGTRFVRFRRLRSAGLPAWSEAMDQLARNGRGS